MGENEDREIEQQVKGHTMDIPQVTAPQTSHAKVCSPGRPLSLKTLKSGDCS
jgi:hypothetical protein